MADGRYASRRPPAHEYGKLGAKTPGETTYSRPENGRAKPAFIITKTEVVQDHVLKPAMFDADGKAKAAMVILPPSENGNGVITKIETVEEHFYEPPTVGYTSGTGKHGGNFLEQPSKINELIMNAQANEGQRRMGFPNGMFQRPTSDANNFGRMIDASTNPWSRPLTGVANGGDPSGWSRTNGGTISNNGYSGWSKAGSGTATDGGSHGWRRPSGDTGSSGWSKPISGNTDDGSANGRSRPTTKDISTSGLIQPTGEACSTDWSKPADGWTKSSSDTGSSGWSKAKVENNGRTRPNGGRGDVSVTTTRQPNYNGPPRKNDTTMDGPLNSAMNAGGRSRPSNSTGDIASTTIHQPNYDSSSGKKEPAMDGPRLATVTAPSRPARFNWATSPTYESSISRPTSDIDAAVDYVKESIKMPAVAAGPQKGQFSSSPPQVAKGKMVETIDSKEAARRYDGLEEVILPGEVPSGTINSREAARKYKGVLIENQPVSSV